MSTLTSAACAEKDTDSLLETLRYQNQQLKSGLSNIQTNLADSVSVNLANIEN